MFQLNSDVITISWTTIVERRTGKESYKFLAGVLGINDCTRMVGCTWWQWLLFHGHWTPKAFGNRLIRFRGLPYLCYVKGSSWPNNRLAFLHVIVLLWSGCTDSNEFPAERILPCGRSNSIFIVSTRARGAPKATKSLIWMLMLSYQLRTDVLENAKLSQFKGKVFQ